MKPIFSRLLPSLIALFFASLALAQAPTPPGGYTGQSLRTWFKQNYYNGQHIQHSYQNARIRMYNYIDNYGSTVTGVYSGYQKLVTYGGSTSNPQPINCEHTVPQSYFNYQEPMKSDLHHLFPTYGSWNSVRSNHPFYEINDNATTKWMYLDNDQSSIPSSNIDSYSEFDYPKFEPREDHKGNVARAVFYFYTMYPTQAGDIEDVVGSLEMLYEWHLNDPVDTREYQRNIDIAAYQGSRNPYIDYPGYAGIAWEMDSVIRTSPDSCDMVDLIITEYVDGTGTNCAIEIGNYTGASVSLANYSIQQQANGIGGWSSGLALSGTLADNDVYVIVASTATESDLTNKADLLTAASELYFTGNDVIGLFRQGSLIDIVGVKDQTTVFAKNVTLVRQETIQQPATSYDALEWDQYALDMYDSLGTHYYDCEVTVVIDTTTGGPGPEEEPDTIAACFPDTLLTTTTADLFFSEYVESSYLSQSLEIANFTGASVDLSDYVIRQQSNGIGGWSSGTSLTGSLADSGNYVVTFAYASDSYQLAQTDLLTYNSELYYTGNDVIGLFKNGTLIDAIGWFGFETTFAKDVTLRRKCFMEVPNTTYCPAEWEAASVDDFSDLGSHIQSPTCSTSKREATKPTTEAALTTASLKLYPNPADDYFMIDYSSDLNAGSMEVMITDISGRPVSLNGQSTALGAGKVRINTAGWASGVYMITVLDRGQRTFGKITVQ